MTSSVGARGSVRIVSMGYSRIRQTNTVPITCTWNVSITVSIVLHGTWNHKFNVITIENFKDSEGLCLGVRVRKEVRPRIT